MKKFQLLELKDQYVLKRVRGTNIVSRFKEIQIST